MHTSDNVSVVMVCFGPDAPPRRCACCSFVSSMSTHCQPTLLMKETLAPAVHRLPSHGYESVQHSWQGIMLLTSTDTVTKQVTCVLCQAIRHAWRDSPDCV